MSRAAPGRNGHAYHMAASLYQRLGSATGYVRAHGIDPLRQEAMVLEFIRAHGSIRRRDVMELCGLGGAQARCLLARLRSKHPEFRLVGEKRGARHQWVDDASG